jgi:hypothetical protein
MKKITLFLILAILFSCKKNTNTLKGEIVEKKQNDYQFLKSQFLSMAKILAPEINSPSKRKEIVKKAREMFDEESEVLIKNLPNLDSKQIVNLEILENDIRNRSGSKIYTQIYIPKYKDYINNNRQLIEPEIEEPILVFYTGNAEVDSSQNQILPGYKFINGELTFFNMIDENYADNNEVWVISVNEVVDLNGNYKLPNPCELDFENPCGGGGGSEGGGGGSYDDDPTDAPSAIPIFPELNHPKENFKIPNMVIKNPKESWVSGASEISIKAKLTCHNGRERGYRFPASQLEYRSKQYSNRLGCLIKKVKRKDVKNRTNLFVNFTMQDNWQTAVGDQDPIFFDYLIFERDPWPAKMWTPTVFGARSDYRFLSDPSTYFYSMQYRSSDNYDETPYKMGTFCGLQSLSSNPNSYAGSGLVNNTEITFNTIKY